MAVGPLANIDPRDVAAIDLERILQRLDHKVLSPEADPQLQHSSYERSKTRTVRYFYSITILCFIAQSTSANDKDILEFRVCPYPTSSLRT